MARMGYSEFVHWQALYLLEKEELDKQRQNQQKG